MTYDVANKACLVTGANRGIGKALVGSLLAAGAKKVYAGVRQLPSADPLVAEFGAAKVVPIHLDLTDNASIKLAASTTASDVQVVVNNAGILLQSTGSILDDLEEVMENLSRELDVNVNGLLRMAHAFGPILKRLGADGCFVQINSTASVRCPNVQSVATYGASKAAAFSISQSLRDALVPHGVSVYSVHPGPVDTDMAQSAGFSKSAPSAESVATNIVRALQGNQFTVFPDEKSKMIGDQYLSFAESVIGNKSNNKDRSPEFQTVSPSLDSR
jgi:NAD(P)-dependent dehydrogenase (short-subunit alcohol dehydrogenase family)